MIDYCNAFLKDIVPENLQSEKITALGYALHLSLKKLQDHMSNCSVYASLEELPERILDLLAIELRAQYYDQTLDIETKRKIIAQSYSWYLRAGTPSVIEEYLSTLFDGGRVYEWFDYAGDPYNFKVEVAVNEKPLTSADDKRIKKQIRTCKNTRSWLERLFYSILAAYQVDIRYSEKLDMHSDFHPRYNLAFHMLEGVHFLDGSKALNGYDNDKNIDFYPSNLEITGQIKETLESDAQVFSCTGKSEVVKGFACGITVRDKLRYLDGSRVLNGTHLLYDDECWHEL